MVVVDVIKRTYRDYGKQCNGPEVITPFLRSTLLEARRTEADALQVHTGHFVELRERTYRQIWGRLGERVGPGPLQVALVTA